MIHIEHFIFNCFQTNCWILWDKSGKCAIIDPGCQSEEETRQVTDFIASNGLEPECILLTHCHFDHIYGMASLANKYEIPVYLDKDEMYSIEVTNEYLCRQFGFPMPDSFPISKTSETMSHKSRAEFVTEGDMIPAGSLSFEVIGTPGHSKGGLCFLERNEKVLISGDTLFAGAIGRTDHPGGDYDQMMRNIFEKLLMLEGDTRILPGHGPSSDISTERMTNPFLLPFNEPYEDED